MRMRAIIIFFAEGEASVCFDVHVPHKCKQRAKVVREKFPNAWIIATHVTRVDIHTELQCICHFLICG